MVVLRARRKKLAFGLRPGDNEDGSGARHQAQARENRRRGALYDLSSSNGKQLPSVSLQPADARVRRDLLRLTQLEDKRVESDKKSVYEDEQNDCKHREQLNYRPPMDQIHKLRDLHTTVAKDCRDQVRPSADQRIFAKIDEKNGSKQYGNAESMKPEWRLGYSNNIDTGSRAGVGGTFEPRDRTRERILDSPALLPDSVAVAYPLNKSDNQDETKDNRLVYKSHRCRIAKKKPWCPASSSKSPSSASSRRRYPVERFIPSDLQENDDLDLNDHDGLQRFPIRSTESFEPIEAQADFVFDPRCADRQQTLSTKVAETYSRVRARIDRLKEPRLRYKLPVEDATQHPRSYRLGLDDVPSTASTKPKKGKEKLNFRPKSAGASVGFQTRSQAPKRGNLLAQEFNGNVKVAGARRRPHSANITFFKHSTVYCMEPPTPSKLGCTSAATDFRSVVGAECQKRQRERDTILQKLAKRGLLHSIPLAQVFARLRREGLLNIDRRLQRSIFERMTLDEYMSACGCLNSNTAPAPTVTSDTKQHSDTPGSSLIKETKRFLKNTEVVNSGVISLVDASPSLIATRKTLVVSRQQFHLALEPFNLSPSDVNLFFSALDLTVSDFVQVWDAMCTVEMLQIEHTAIRRARVQQLQAPPAKDLEFFRRINK